MGAKAMAAAIKIPTAGHPCAASIVPNAAVESESRNGFWKQGNPTGVDLDNTGYPDIGLSSVRYIGA